MSLHDRCTVCAKHTMAQKSFWTHPMVLLCDEAQVEARFGPFGDSASLDVDRCTVCAKRTIGSETVLDAPMVLLCDEGQVQDHFGLFRDSASLDSR